MPPASLPYESKQSTLLSPDENQQISRLLGPRCQSLATTVVQLFESQPPNHLQWIKKDTGILCFVRDNQRKNYFFRIYCFKKNKMIWEYEMYNNMDYIASCAFLHTFEGDDCMVCFNFANDDEAKEFKTIVDAKILAKRKREARKSRTPSTNDEVQLRNNRNNSQVIMKHTDPFAKKAKRKRNITKADIGKPSEFRHISHVGWDPDKGFDVNTEDAQLNDFFHKAGVSESQLKDRETRQFIYDFIAANGGRDAVIEQESKAKKPPPAIPSSTPSTPASGPPVPPRGSIGPERPTHNRAAPPPPPSANQPPPRPPPSTPRSRQLPPINAPIPPPPSGNAPPPPPPPPPPPADIQDSPPLPSYTPIKSDQRSEIAPPVDNRSALLQSIRGGLSLKPVEVEKKPAEPDARCDLLSEIRKGFSLKPANEREVKPMNPALMDEKIHVGNDLAAALSRALAERNRVIHPDDDDTSSSSDFNGDEWDA